MIPENRTDNAAAADRILQHRARILARETESPAAEGDVLPLLAFSLGKERFGIGIERVREVQPLKRLKWSRVPCTPDFIVGAVNIRSRIYSMMHIGRYLGNGGRRLTEHAHVILVGGGGIEGAPSLEVSLISDDMPEPVRVDPRTVQPSDGKFSARSQAFISGVTEGMLTLLDLDRLLSAPDIIVDEDTN